MKHTTPTLLPGSPCIWGGENFSLVVEQMAQRRVRGNPLFFRTDNHPHLRLDAVVVGFDTSIHTVVALVVNKLMDYGDRLINLCLSRHGVIVNHNLGMKNLLVYALVEVVAYSGDEYRGQYLFRAGGRFYRKDAL